MQEELGDLLLQIAFQARVAQEHATEPFDIDDVAGGLVDKLVRRHPHVFAEVEAATADAVEANWEAIKAAEKQHRTHPLEGVPTPSRPWPGPRSTCRGCTGPAGTTSSTRPSQPGTSAHTCWTSSDVPGSRALTRKPPCARFPAAAGAAFSRDRRRRDRPTS